MRIGNHQQVAHRNERLMKCARLTALMLGLTEEQLGALIEAMYDRKGTLHVQWAHQPTNKGQMAVDDAWRECKEQKTEHHWPVRPGSPIELYEFAEGQ
jgi:hypothetical protein